MGAAQSVQRIFELVRLGDDDPFSACCQERQRAFNLGTHAAGQKMTFIEVLAALRAQGLWPDRSPLTGRPRVTISRDQIGHHQFVVALALGQQEQGIPLTDADRRTFERAVQFLECIGHGPV